jgi:hypothetical protein
VRDVLALLDAEEREALRAEQGDEDLAAAETYDASWLLQWLAVRRTPFVKMAAEVCGMLSSLEASLRGNISFIVLPEHGVDLTVDFRPQMRGAVATALRMSELGNSIIGIDRKVRQSMRQLCDNFRPRPVTRPDSTGKMLLDRHWQIMPGIVGGLAATKAAACSATISPSHQTTMRSA